MDQARVYPLELVTIKAEPRQYTRTIGFEQNVGMDTEVRMNSGLQGESSGISDALGRPLHDLRISLLDRCNFRCPYCMPET